MTYKTKGTCSQMIEFEITDGKVHNVKFTFSIIAIRQ